VVSPGDREDQGWGRGVGRSAHPPSEVKEECQAASRVSKLSLIGLTSMDSAQGPFTF
jgi:hypothetical protein